MFICYIFLPPYHDVGENFFFTVTKDLQRFIFQGGKHPSPGLYKAHIITWFGSAKATTGGTQDSIHLQQAKF